VNLTFTPVYRIFPRFLLPAAKETAKVQRGSERLPAGQRACSADPQIFSQKCLTGYEFVHSVWGGAAIRGNWDHRKKSKGKTITKSPAQPV